MYPLPTKDEVVIQDHVNNYVLVAGVNTVINVPTGASIAAISATHNIWVKIGGVAVIPSENVIDGSGQELNPLARWVSGAGTIGVISESAAKMSISFFQD